MIVKKVAGILYQNRRVLVSMSIKRDIRRMTWFFPIAQVIEGESPKKTLIDFFRDKLGLEVEPYSYFMEFKPSEDPAFAIHLYKVRIKGGALKRGPGLIDVKWIEPSSIPRYFTNSIPYSLSQYFQKLR